MLDSLVEQFWLGPRMLLAHRVHGGKRRCTANKAKPVHRPALTGILPVKSVCLLQLNGIVQEFAVLQVGDADY